MTIYFHNIEKTAISTDNVDIDICLLFGNWVGFPQLVQSLRHDDRNEEPKSCCAYARPL
jgi:hypothetical protein